MHLPGKWFFGILLLLAGSSRLAADQIINFSNNNLGSPQLVRFCYPDFGSLHGGGVVNGLAGGPSYVAQLFRILPDGSEVAVGERANFRAATTTSPGTWVGSSRTVAGVPQGTPLLLQVKAWDAAFGSLEAAAASGKAVGVSAVFRFQDAMSNPPAPADILMVNFRGFYIGCIPEPKTIAMGLLGSLFVLWLPRRNKQ